MALQSAKTRRMHDQQCYRANADKYKEAAREAYESSTEREKDAGRKAYSANIYIKLIVDIKKEGSEA